MPSILSSSRNRVALASVGVSISSSLGDALEDSYRMVERSGRIVWQFDNDETGQG
jgi:hypothetical protein